MAAKIPVLMPGILIIKTALPVLMPGNKLFSGHLFQALSSSVVHPFQGTELPSPSISVKRNISGNKGI